MIRKAMALLTTILVALSVCLAGCTSDASESATNADDSGETSDTAESAAHVDPCACLDLSHVRDCRGGGPNAGNRGTCTCYRFTWYATHQCGGRSVRCPAWWGYSC